jgi:hypothetical protein
MTKEAEAPEAPPTTEDGIPLFANGRKLTEKEIAILREARERRAAIDARAAEMPREVDGGDRPAEPTRYGDWEKSGRAYDFS